MPPKAAISTGWPTGFTFRATHHYRNYADPIDWQDEGNIQLRIGDFGDVVNKLRVKNEQGKNVDSLLVRNDRTGQLGWIPAEIVAVSQTKVGDFKVIVKDQRVIRSSPPRLDLEATGRFPKAVEALLNTIHDQKLNLPSVQESVWGLMGNNGQHISKIVNLAVRGAGKANTLGILNTPNFLIDDLIKRAVKVTDLEDEESAIYLRIYFEVPGRPVDEYHLYVGESHMVIKRHQAHQCQFEDVDCLEGHYKHVRGAKLVAILLCRSSDFAGMVSRSMALRVIIEQVFILLLGTYDRRLFMSSPPSGSAPEVLNTIQTRSTFTEDATAFRNIANLAAQLSGWTGHGSSNRGRNIESPLCQHKKYEKMLWFRTERDVPGVGPCELFQRVSKVVTSTEGESKSSSIHGPGFWRPSDGTGQSNMSFTMIGDIKPKTGSLVRMEIELRKDGKTHPKSYAALSSIGPFEDWELANSMAIRLVWTDEDGVDHHDYTRQDGIRFKDVTETGSGSQSTYIRAKAMIRYLKRQVPETSDIRSWDYLMGTARVMPLTLDYWTQTFTIHPELGTSNEPIPSCKRRDKRDIKQSFEGAGLHVGPNFPDWAPGQSQGKFGRHKAQKLMCDCCILRRWIDRNGTVRKNPLFAINCEQRGTSNCCSSCFQMGHPFCSWTRLPHPAAANAAELQELQRLCRALVNQIHDSTSLTLASSTIKVDLSKEQETDDEYGGELEPMSDYEEDADE